MFSWTRSRTGSCPFTSEKRVSRSSGMYVSMPPRDRNQKSPPNWMMMNRNPNDSWKTKGRAATRRPGASRSPNHTGSVLNRRPRKVLSANRKMKRLERPRRAEPRPVIHLPQPTRGTGEDGLLPEAVIPLRMFFDQEMGLPDHLDAEEHQEPGVVVERDPHRVGERATDRVHGGGPHDREPACPQTEQQDHELDPIPERGGHATLPLGQPRTRRVRRTGGDRGAIALLAHGNTVQESTIDEISELLRW